MSRVGPRSGAPCLRCARPGSIFPALHIRHVRIFPANPLAQWGATRSAADSARKDMNNTRLATWVLAGMVLGLAACGGGGDETGPPPAPSPAPPPPPAAGTVIGAAGGTVTGPNGAKVVIPSGALTTDTRILI